MTVPCWRVDSLAMFSVRYPTSSGLHESVKRLFFELRPSTAEVNGLAGALRDGRVDPEACSDTTYLILQQILSIVQSFHRAGQILLVERNPFT